MLSESGVLITGAAGGNAAGVEFDIYRQGNYPGSSENHWFIDRTATTLFANPDIPVARSVPGFSPMSLIPGSNAAQ